jgi:6-phosphogluconolactonase
LPDRSNKFVYAATLGANQVLQFTFDSKTGKLTSNDPAAVTFCSRPGTETRRVSSRAR